MLIRKHVSIIVIGLTMLCQNLFAQIIVTGVVINNGDEPVEGALVELIDEEDTTRVFSNTTNAEGKYTIIITETGIDTEPALPQAFRLLQNYPNPFNPSTVISYEIPYPAHVRIEIYNVLGQRIKTLFDAMQTDLHGRVLWDATNEQGKGVAAGVYIYSLIADNVRINHKMLLLDGCFGKAKISEIASAEPEAGSRTGMGKTVSNLYTLKITGRDLSKYIIKHQLIVTHTIIPQIVVFRIVCDIDGNLYNTVKICGQWWMTKNLNVTHYRNGDPIPCVSEEDEWEDLVTGAYCYYDNNESYAGEYGALYNGYAVNDNRQLAPAGWHVANEAEWQTLFDCLGGINVAGSKLKETGTTHWLAPNSDATNESGFTALPGGWRSWSNGSIGEYAYFRAFGEIFHPTYNLRLEEARVSIGSSDLFIGTSVRCVMGETEAVPNSPILYWPVNGSANEFFSPTLKWNAMPGAASFELQVATDPGFVNLYLVQNNLNQNYFDWPNIYHYYYIAGLADSTTYYWRVNAANSGGTSNWSETWSFTTMTRDSGFVSDYDGNVYKTIKIGNQWWMAENLRVKHYCNGEPIAHVTADSVWRYLKNGAYCYYNNDGSNAADFGALYNWFAVADNRKLAPAGWHVPTDDDWKQLELYMGINPGVINLNLRGFDEGGKLKQAGTDYWLSPNEGATNASRFSALPGGGRRGYTFHHKNVYAYFWTSSEEDERSSFGRRLSYNDKKIERLYSYESKISGFSVRCIKD
ncbi:MAG TPA: FISUMP domain-containing protein [bacterium]|nr:FISUMP domain-containing protein [bacterium]HPN42602.1 FISUMP domain-containing protein [bacterium]